MKKNIFTLLTFLLLVVIPSFGQEAKVKDMHHAVNDSTAELKENEHVDLNGEKGGLIKVYINSNKVTFKNSYIFETKKHAEGEYWVFMAKGASNLSIYADGFLPLDINFRDYNCSVQPLATYILTIDLPDSGKDGKADSKQFFSLTVVPANASVTIDGKPQQLTNGALNVQLSKGRHTYKVEAKGYSTKTDNVVIGDNKQIRNVTLEAVYGKLKIDFQPEDALVLIDDVKKVGTGVLAIEKIPIGEHKVVIRKKGYKSFEKTVVIPQNKEAVVNVKLQDLSPLVLNVRGLPLKMIPIEGGTFIMGNTKTQDSDAEDDEQPAHQVTLSEYMIGETEVTLGLWKLIMGTIPTKEYRKETNQAIDNVGWDDCQKFIQKLNDLTGMDFRLPTEAEWEFAARGGIWSEGKKYAGDMNPEMVGYCAGYISRVSIVGSKKPNELGLYDMTGNVREWCQDWYGPYGSEPQTNPKGPETGSSHVARGGGWVDYPIQCRNTKRFSDGARWNIAQGFRLVLPRIIQQSEVQPGLRMPNGQLEVNIMPKGATVYVDGKKVGVTPGVFKDIVAGKHKVVVSMEGYKTVSEDVEVPINSFARLKGELRPGAPVISKETPPEPVKESFTANGVTFRMVRVEGGMFIRGATDEMEADGNNEPSHDVTLDGFMIGETEVTQKLWRAVMGTNPSHFKGDDLPVENITWFECWDFIDKLDKLTGKDFSLPTEAEWEFAARGGKYSRYTPYSGGTELEEVGWYWGNSGDQPMSGEFNKKASKKNNNTTHPVAQKKPNELGLYDMAGNVWEWCYDWFRVYDDISLKNPVGGKSGFFRIYRGGSWRSEHKACFTVHRYCNRPNLKFDNLGFRLVLRK